MTLLNSPHFGWLDPSQVQLSVALQVTVEDPVNWYPASHVNSTVHPSSTGMILGIMWFQCPGREEHTISPGNTQRGKVFL